MKVLFINNIYPSGSTGNIIKQIANELEKQGHEYLVATCYGKSTNKSICFKNRVEIILNRILISITGNRYGYAYFQTKKVIRIIKKFKPDIINLHCVNSDNLNLYKLLDWIKDSGIKLVITMHSEQYYTGNCDHACDCNKFETGCGKCPYLKLATHSSCLDFTNLHWKRLKNAFSKFNNIKFVAVSDWVKDRAKKSPLIGNNEILTIANGVDTTIFKYRNDNQAILDKIDKNKKTIIHVTPNLNDPHKGGQYVIELAKRLEKDNVQIILVGNSDKDISLPPNIINFGYIFDQNELAKLYSIADLTLLTSLRETFSLVTAESLCCGTPVVGFKAGGPETIAIKEFSSFVDNGDVDALYNKIKKFLDMRVDKEKISKVSIEKYDDILMSDKYISLYKKC